MHPLDILASAIILVLIWQFVFRTLDAIFDRPWLVWSIVAVIAGVVYVSAKGLWPAVYGHSQWLWQGALLALLVAMIVAGLYQVEQKTRKLLMRARDIFRAHKERREAQAILNEPQDDPTYLPRDWTLFRLRDRVFHQKYGNGTVVATDGSKLTIEFDAGGVKRIVDSFVQKL